MSSTAKVILTTNSAAKDLSATKAVENRSNQLMTSKRVPGKFVLVNEYS